MASQKNAWKHPVNALDGVRLNTSKVLAGYLKLPDPPLADQEVAQLMQLRQTVNVVTEFLQQVADAFPMSADQAVAHEVEVLLSLNEPRTRAYRDQVKYDAARSIVQTARGRAGL
jgi:hypothetical protein